MSTEKEPIVLVPPVEEWSEAQWKEAVEDNRDDANALIPRNPIPYRKGGEGARGSYSDDDGTEFSFGVPEEGTPEHEAYGKGIAAAREALDKSKGK